MTNKFSSEHPTFSKEIIAWYENNKRELPWRLTKKPYNIWLSEVILQQTRVAQGLPYFLRFIATYPTIKQLASADEQDVLRLWQGLGYYSRARNMHATARIITDELNAEFPKTYKELLGLKGIGPYTAAAIASFAYDECVPVVDGNVFRVLSRVFGVETDISSSSARKVFEELANKLIPKDNPAAFNQAIMEFGALQCTPKNPNCLFCPLRDSCYAYEHRVQDKLPVKLKKTKVTNRYFTYVAFKHNNKFLLRKRKENDIWAGLYEFYLIESLIVISNFEEIEDALVCNLRENIKLLTFVESRKHILSHQHLFANFWLAELPSNISETGLKNFAPEYHFYDLEEIMALPKSALTASFIETISS